MASLVEEHIGELAALETMHAGVLTRVAEWGVRHVRDALLYSAGGVERLVGKQIPVAGGLDVTFHEPLGVVAIIAPWNFPLVIAGRGIAAPLAAGNAVIVKPSELTPLTAIRLAKLAADAGMPEGLVQVVVGHGPTVGNRLVEHPGVRGIAFTGSTVVGRQIMAAGAEQLKRLNLELGGKSANIIFGDADLEFAAQRVPDSAFDLAGQDCCARSRLLIEQSALDDFMTYLEPVVTDLVVGDPRDAVTDLGPLISQRQRDRVASYLDQDVEVAFQGSAPEGRDRRNSDSRTQVVGPTVAYVLREDIVAGAVFWFRTSRTGVSRHPGMMSREIPDSAALHTEPSGHDIYPFADHRDGGREPSCP